MDATMLLWILLIFSFPTALIINWLMTDKSDMRGDTADNLPGRRQHADQLQADRFEADPGGRSDDQGETAREVAARRIAART